MKVHTNSAQETQHAGKIFAKKLVGGDTILLYGNLGAGKTTFVQGLAKGLGIEKRIISPTFIIVRRYEVLNSSSSEQSESRSSRQARTIKWLYHIDLYRTQTEDDVKGLGIDEILQEKDAIVAIEWPEKLGSFLPKKRWELRFENHDIEEEYN
ncbi:MAG TPA: tRNA (adenosine(37)-N6)-threonylcarbamoyltransferase complex ATPase subunit type 1 TsaE [Candidatus Eisenbacteria bacterium]|nr:tRNA (adenosine(37)-N6)-threonylcarbamoyltransferase complex ATPase subunit type 1 TsaE [Candidatus Eisenbacteria bacterium]